MACGSGCCGGEQPKPVQVDSTKSPSPSPTELVSRPEGNTTLNDGKDADAKSPSCCKDKLAPCCDDACLDRLALRACESDEKDCVSVQDESSDGCSVKVASVSQRRRQGAKNRSSACKYHIRKTRETYAATLEAIGCICRALLALGQESCCTNTEKSSVERRRRSASSSRSSGPKSKTCPKSCCSTAVEATTTTATVSRPRSRDCCGTLKSKEAQEPAQAVVTGSSSKSCCTKAPAEPVVTDACSTGSSCCGESDPPAEPSHLFVPQNTAVNDDLAIISSSSPPTTTDLEKGYAANFEHVILSVSGMTCSGCETKLVRTLASFPGIRNLKTSLVLSRAQFDLDLNNKNVLGSASSASDVIKYLERTTEFKCLQIKSCGFSVEVIVPDAAGFVAGTTRWPKGVTDLAVVDKTTVRVEYDPAIIGARDLLYGGAAGGGGGNWLPRGHQVKLAPLRPDASLAAGNKHVKKVGYMTLLSIVLTLPVLVLAWTPLPEEKELDYAWASLVLATLVQVLIAGPFYPNAVKGLLFSRVVEMDLLIVLSTSAAYIFSVVSFGYLVSGDPLETGSFFETSTLLVTLIMVGRYVAALARQKAVESISVRSSLQVNTAVLVDVDGNGRGGQGDREIDLRLLQFGDLFKVFPESKVPTDGTVISGESEVDESMITGESAPVEKRKWSTLIAGTINGSGTLVAKVTRLPGENTIDAIAGMVDQAKLSKPKLQDLADKVASMFVPVIVSLMVVVLLIWVAVGLRVQKLSGGEAAIQAVTYAITVLIVSCPCAIGLAVPMVIVIASGVAAKHGVIFKSGESIEVACKASHVILDKTGTLTEGKLTVVSVDHGESDDPDAASLLLGMVQGIKHPVSAAITAYLQGEGIVASAKVSGVKAIPGKGLEVTLCGGKVLRAGNSRWLEVDDQPRVQTLLAQGYTVFCFTINGILASVFALRDSIRADTLPTIQELQARGVSVHVLSGDDDGAVRAVTNQLGIPEANVRSRCAPADKQAYTQSILNTPDKPVVIFCGDGTNDAVALAQATVGIAINRDEESSIGADVAKSAADVVLMRPNLSGILTVMSLSRKSVRRIWFNFGWSFVYNLFALLLAGGAFVTLNDVRIPPEYAALGELVSVLPVIAAAVVMRWEKV